MEKASKVQSILVILLNDRRQHLSADGFDQLSWGRCGRVKSKVAPVTFQEWQI